MREVSIFSDEIILINFSPNSSLPTVPTKATSAPNLDAATA
jgi:hypothetical protein